MKSGRTLWDELVFTYTRGAEEAQRTRGAVDRPARERSTTNGTGRCSHELGRQAADAAAWRDKCLGYFDAARTGRQSVPPAEGPSQATAPKDWTASDDHRHMLDQLGIRSLRPGPSGNEQAPNHANYDETAANPFPVLPDPLTFNDGRKVATPQAWWRERRGEIVEMFEREVYGRVPALVPGVTWIVARTIDATIGGRAVIDRQLVGHVDSSAYPLLSVDMALELVLPAAAPGPVPVVIMFRPRGMPGAPPAADQLIARGWGYALLDPGSIQADNGAGLTKGIIGLVNKGQPRKPDDWGALRAWAWGASRVLRLPARPIAPWNATHRHRRRLALRQSGAGHDGVRPAVRDGARRIVRRGRRQAAPPQLGRGGREPHRQRRVPLDGGQLPQVRRGGGDVRQPQRRRPAGGRARADRALRAAPHVHQLRRPRKGRREVARSPGQLHGGHRRAAGLPPARREGPRPLRRLPHGEDAAGERRAARRPARVAAARRRPHRRSELGVLHPVGRSPGQHRLGAAHAH